MCFFADDADFFSIVYSLRSLSIEEIYYVGLALGINHKRLMEVKESKFFLNEMVQFWLSEVDNVSKKGTPSWEVLVDVLNLPMIGQNGLAQKIMEEHATK